MLLKRLDIENFRLFYGPHTIDFATKKGMSVTVFHGENGAGKTTLLNAIHWCLTNKFTPGVNKPDVIINDEFPKLNVQSLENISLPEKRKFYVLKDIEFLNHVLFFFIKLFLCIILFIYIFS